MINVYHTLNRHEYCVLVFIYMLQIYLYILYLLREFEEIHLQKDNFDLFSSHRMGQADEIIPRVRYRFANLICLVRFCYHMYSQNNSQSLATD